MGIEKSARHRRVSACLGYYGLVWFEGQHYVTLLAIAAPDGADEHLRVHVSEIWDRADYSSIFRHFYLGIMLSYLYQVRAMADGKYLVWLIFKPWG